MNMNLYIYIEGIDIFPSLSFSLPSVPLFVPVLPVFPPYFFVLAVSLYQHHAPLITHYQHHSPLITTTVLHHHHQSITHPSPPLPLLPFTTTTTLHHHATPRKKKKRNCKRCHEKKDIIEKRNSRTNIFGTVRINREPCMENRGREKGNHA